jgi:anti-sigma factor RsiW
MTCDEVLRVLSPYLDGELPAESAARIACHLEKCSRCRSYSLELDDVAMLVRALPQPALPEGLEESVREGLQTAAGERGARWRRRAAVAMAPVISAAAAAAITALILVAPGSGDGGAKDPVGDLLAAHVRSLLDGEPTRITSDDSHMVRPWFAGRLDFAPSTPDLRAHGFPLLGGRLDYVDGRVVAAIVYRRRQHVINVFAAPETGPTVVADEVPSLRRGYHVISWQAGDLTYFAVSDLNSAELEIFRSLFQDALQPPR